MIQYNDGIRPVEAFDVRVLGGLARLDVRQLNTVPMRPLPQRGTDELRDVVQERVLGCATH